MKIIRLTLLTIKYKKLGKEKTWKKAWARAKRNIID